MSNAIGDGLENEPSRQSQIRTKMPLLDFSGSSGGIKGPCRSELAHCVCLQPGETESVTIVDTQEVGDWAAGTAESGVWRVE